MLSSKLRLYSRLQRAAHSLKKASDTALLEAAGVTTAQAAVLSIVDRQSDVTQKEVAALLGLNESAVTAMVNRLLKLGYLERTRSATDGRVRHLRLTDEGHETMVRVKGPFRAINTAMEKALGSDEAVEAFADALATFTKQFEKD